jgi:hypothetical protein
MRKRLAMAGSILFLARKPLHGTIPISRRTWNLPLQSMGSWSMQTVNSVAAAFRAGASGYQISSA